MLNKKQNSALLKVIENITPKKAIAIIVILGFVVFFNSLFNGFVWDDLPQYINNPKSHSILNIFQILKDYSMTYYRPFPAIVFSGIYSIFGPTAFWYHLFQLTLHIVNSILIFLLFKKFIPKIISLSLALIFLVHPMNVESVVYISAMQTVLSLFFGLLAIHLLIKKKIQPFYRYFLIFTFILLSILSKEIGLLFVVLPLLFMKLNEKYIFTKKDYIYTLTSGLLAVFLFLYLSTYYAAIIRGIESVSPVPIMRASFAERILTLPKILSYYLITFVYPKSLTISQQWIVTAVNIKDFVIPVIVSLVSFVFMGIAALLLSKKSKKVGLYSFFAVWFLVSWGTVWQVVPLRISMTVADRWFYMPMVGLLGIIGVIASTFKTRNKNTKLLLAGLMTFLLFAFSLRTVIRNSNWKDGITLFAHDEKINNNSYQLSGDLGYLYLISSQPDKAKPHLDKSIQLAPYWWENWNNLGAYYEMKGDIDESINALRTANQNNKNYYHADISLAFMYYKYKRPEETKEQLLGILDKYPQDPFLFYMLGMTDYNLGNKNDALVAMLSAYNLSKNNEYLKIYYLMEKDQKVD